jgi:hypothetical protein
MVHVVVFIGEAGPLQNASAVLRQASAGWIELRPGVWLVGSALDAGAVRDIFNAVPGVQVVVAKLSGNWAARGMPGTAEWLKTARNAF